MSFGQPVFSALVLIASLGIIHAVDSAKALPSVPCKDMRPDTEELPQMTACPFGFKLEKDSMHTDERINVRLVVKDSPDSSFLGFMMMAFDATEDHTPIGQFSVDTVGQDVSVTMDCADEFGGPKSAATHKDETMPKTSVEGIYWTPPVNYSSYVIFKVTFLQDSKVFWVKETSSPVRVTVPEPTTTPKPTTTPEPITTPGPTTTTGAPSTTVSTGTPFISTGRTQEQKTEGTTAGSGRLIPVSGTLLTSLLIVWSAFAGHFA